MRCIKQLLISEFGVFKLATMMYALDDIDEMIVSIITNEIDDLVKKNNALRERIYYLISFKHFADTNNDVNEPTD